MESNTLSPVIIIGGNHHNTQGVIRSLGKKGIKSYVIVRGTSAKKSFVLKSRYVKEGYVEKDEDSILNRVKEIAQRFTQSIKPVVICTSDDASSLIDRHHSEISQFCSLPGAKEGGRITTLMEKTRQFDLAAKEGMNIPETWLVENLSDIDKVLFPCIVKPQASINGSKSDIYIFHHANEFKTYYKSRDFNSILTQTYIERDFEFQLIGCSLRGGEEVIIPGYTRIIRSSNRTNTGVLRYQKIDFDAELEKCRRLMFVTGYSGLFSMEFIRGKDGKNYFLEINFRNDGNAISVTAAGVNLPYVWVLANSNMDYKKELNKSIKSVLVFPIFDDYIHFVKKKKIGIVKWIYELLRADCFMDFQLTDPVPYIHRLIR